MERIVEDCLKGFSMEKSCVDRCRTVGEKIYGEFITAGYSETIACMPFEKHDVSFVKSIYSNDGESKNRLYTIRVCFFDWSKFNIGQAYGLSATCQFNLKDGNSFNVELVHVTSPKQVEDFYSKVYKKLGCVPYE